MSDEKTKLKAFTTNEVEAPRPEVRSRRLPALTSNKVEAKLPSYPEPKDRKSAKGPIITTGNIEEIRARNAAAPKYKVVITEPKPGEPSPADWIDKQFKSDAESAQKKGRGRKS